MEHKVVFFFNLIISFIFSGFHFCSPTYFKHPTIDLTCFCKNDFDSNLIMYLLLFFLMFAKLIVLMGLLAVQDDDLKAEKLCVPRKNFIAVFIFE